MSNRHWQVQERYKTTITSLLYRGLTLNTSTGSLSMKIERMYTKAGADEKIAVTSVEEITVRPLR